MSSAKEPRVNHWDEWLFDPCHASGHGDLDGPMTSGGSRSRGARDRNKAAMIGSPDRVDGSRVANGREIGKDREDATGIDVRELFAEDRGGWRTGRKS